MREKRVFIVPGESAARYFRRIGKSGAAATRGVQRKEGKSWVTVGMGYIMKKGDVVRIRPARGNSSPASGLVSLVRSLVLHQAKR